MGWDREGLRETRLPIDGPPEPPVGVRDWRRGYVTSPVVEGGLAAHAFAEAAHRAMRYFTQENFDLMTITMHVDETTMGDIWKWTALKKG